MVFLFFQIINFPEAMELVTVIIIEKQTQFDTLSPKFSETVATINN